MRSTSCSASRWEPTISSASRSRSACWSSGSRRCCAAPSRRTVRQPLPSRRRAIERGKLVMDPDRHACTWDGKAVTLTVTEFLILQSLAQRPGIVKSRDALMDAAYDDQVYVDDRTIDSHIKRLRKKFKQVDDSFECHRNSLWRRLSFQGSLGVRGQGCSRPCASRGWRTSRWPTMADARTRDRIDAGDVCLRRPSRRAEPAVRA